MCAQSGHRQFLCLPQQYPCPQNCASLSLGGQAQPLAILWTFGEQLYCCKTS